MILPFVFVFGAWILSLSFHEFSHALVAYWGGDTSVKDKGYLTFNPLKYTHPVLTFLIPILFLAMGGIGLPGGAVYIERHRLRGPGWDAAVSIAGPAANAILAVLLAVPFVLGLVPLESRNWIWPSLAFLFELQVTAFLFNLIPVPPLDGYGFIAAWLPRETQVKIEAVSSQMFWILLAILWFSDSANAALWRGIFTILRAVRVPPELAYEGYELFKFWS
jgi:Zn-dependent protease